VTGEYEDEVEDLLDEGIKEYEMGIREKRDVQEKVDELNEKLGHFTNIETTLNNSILIAQQTAEELKGNAQKESKLIIKEAEKNADRIVNEALNKSRRIEMDIEEMKKQAKVLCTRFNMYVEDQLDVIVNCYVTAYSIDDYDW